MDGRSQRVMSNPSNAVCRQCVARRRMHARVRCVAVDCRQHVRYGGGGSRCDQNRGLGPSWAA